MRQILQNQLFFSDSKNQDQVYAREGEYSEFFINSKKQK